MFKQIFQLSLSLSLFINDLNIQSNNLILTSTPKKCLSCDSARTLIFPDKNLPCNSFFNRLMGGRSERCYRKECRMLHGYSNEPKSSLIAVFEVLNTATRRMDVCMYLITYGRFSDLLIHLQEARKIQVRVIIDSKPNNNKQINRLRNAGIPTKVTGILANKGKCITSLL